MASAQPQGSHEDLSRQEAVKGGSDRAFGLVFTVVFAIVAAWPLLGGGLPHWWALGVSGVFLALALLRPVLLAPLNRLWTRFGLLLHRIVSPLVLGLMFFLVLTPSGWAMRLLGKDPLRLAFEPEAESYWIEREPPGPQADTMINQF